MRNLIRYITRTLVWLLILGGLIVGGLRLTLANVGLFRAEIESWVSQELAPGIGFGDIRCYWNGVNPILELEKAVITLPDRSRPISVDILSIQFDLWDSLIVGTPIILEVTGSIEKLVVRKDTEKRWWLNDLNLKAASSSEAAGDVEDLLATIPHFLQLELQRLIIEDDSKQRIHQIDNIFVDIQHHDKATHIQLLANLPEALGGALKLSSLLQGDKGVIYLQTGHLKLDPITALLDTPLTNLRRVEMAGEAWVNLRDHRISSVVGKININKARFQPRLDEPAIPFQFAMNFSAEKRDQSWQLVNRVEQLVVNQKNLPDIDSQWRLIASKGGKQIQGWVKRLQVADYLGLAKAYIPDAYRDSILRSKIQGKIENIWLSLPVESPSNIMLMAEAGDLRNQAVDLIPGINHISAGITYAHQQAAINLNSNHLAVDLGDQFRAPFEIDTFHARADAGVFSGEAMLSLSNVKVVNRDIGVAGRFWFESDFTSRPFMSMRLSFEDGIASQKSKYLPVKLLPEAALSWLDNGIRSGDISNGDLLFHGRLEDIEKLDKNGSGELYADFDVNNAELMFDPNWALVKQAKGNLMFHNMGVNIDLESVNYDGIGQVRANIRLPTFANTAVYADISAIADTETALRVWLASPVGVDYREIASNLYEPGGKVKTKIDLFLPIEDDSLQEAVKVRIDLHNAAIKAPAWGVQLSRAKGRVQVTNDTISASGIKAFYFNDPVDIDLTTDAGKQQTLIKANGLLDTQQLLNLLPESLSRGFDGKSVWQIDLVIANKGQTGSQPVLTIGATSGLQGTAVYLPEPYSKSPIVKRRTSANLALLANNEFSFKVDYGTHVKTRGRLEKSGNDDFNLAELDFAFATSLKPQAIRGIRLYGNLPKLPLDEWIVFHQTEKARQKTDSPDLMPLLQSIDLNVTRVALFGRTVSNVDFLLNQSEAGIKGNINSSEAKGHFFFPALNSVQNPATIEMDYLRVAKKVGPDAVTNWLPDDFFNMRFNSRVFTYDGKEVTDLEIDTSLDGESLLIDALKFKHDDIRLESNGYWLYNSATKSHASHLDVVVKGQKFGQSILALGFGDTIHNGSIDFRGEINWPGEIINPNWDILSGKARLKLEDGILKDVEPGSGRFVGLFSLSALPRRLALDFSDVLFDGMEFDEIKGDLVLDGQNLYTKNTRMDGPAAEVKLIGRTGMKDRDYDQKIYVVPKIRYALPVIGTILQGSGVGWGLLLLQSLLKSEIDESVEIEYSMTGSWDDPVVEVLNKPKPKVEKKPQGSGNFEK